MIGARVIRLKTKAIAPTAHKRPFRRLLAPRVLVLVLLILPLLADTPAMKTAQAERRDVQESAAYLLYIVVVVTLHKLNVRQKTTRRRAPRLNSEAR